MRYLFYLGLSTLLLASCGNPYADMELAALQSKKDSLITVSKSISGELSLIDERINDLDTSFYKRLALVTYSSVAPQSFAHYFNIHGVVESDKTSLLLPESGGIIKSIKVKEGDKVRAGQTLARLDAAVVSSQLGELQTALSLATTVFEKQERLWNQKIGSEIQYLQAKNNKESIESSISTLQSQLSMATVKAPYGGIIDEVFSNVGEMASPMSPMFRIVNNGVVYLSSEVSENHINDLNVGSPVEVVFPSFEDTIQAKISEIGDYINPENRSFRVKVNLDQSNNKYLPNLLAGMKVRDYDNENAIVIKSSLVQQSAEGKDFVYLLKKEGEKYFAEKRIVQIGREYQGESEILEGLATGDLLINKGARTVRNGQRLRVQE